VLEGAPRLPGRLVALGRGRAEDAGGLELDEREVEGAVEVALGGGGNAERRDAGAVADVGGGAAESLSRRPVR
jgi:hypothetical protein